MNYMDYVDDNCMNMFTRGQVARMQAALNLERVGILTSLGGTASLGVANFDLDNALQLYPNPSSGIINLNFANYSSFEKTKITVLDIEGKKLKTIENIANSNSKIDLSSFNNGIYFLKIQADGESTTKKIIISK